MKKMKVAIATTSSEKVRGITRGFSKIYQLEETEIEIIFQKSLSNVSEQPFDAETYVGAKNRVDNLMNALTGQEYDFYVSCEAGIENFGDIFFNVQVVCIYEVKSQRYLFGKSSGWQIPSIDISEIKENNLDSYLRKKGITCIEELLGPEFSRNQAVSQATELALVSTRLY